MYRNKKRVWEQRGWSHNKLIADEHEIITNNQVVFFLPSYFWSSASGEFCFDTRSKHYTSTTELTD